MAGHSLKPAIDRGLGEQLPHQLANQARAHPLATKDFVFHDEIPKYLKRHHISSVSDRFQTLSSAQRVDSHVLLTRSPLKLKLSYDLHVLGVPPAFILSQDQTLHGSFNDSLRIA